MHFHGTGQYHCYEINEKTCQISFYNDREMEPDTLEVDSDNFQIPLIIGNSGIHGHTGKRRSVSFRSRKDLR